MDLLKELNLEFRYSKIHGNNFLWPADDQGCWYHLNKKKYAYTPREIVKYCNRTNLVIQAGGNCGIYPKQYSNLFNSVITFEPSWRNFFCLTYNLEEQNIYKFCAALGNTSEPVDIESQLDANNEINVGNIKTVNGTGVIPQVTIDSLGLIPDLIHLDIEGYEPFALLGARKTIERAKPTIALEINESIEIYNWSYTKLKELLFEMDYEKVSQINSLDSVWRHQSFL